MELAYSDLIRGGIRLGSHAPELIGHVQDIAESVGKIKTIVTESFSEPIIEVTEEEIALEAELGQMIAPGGSLALMDFAKLRKAYQILKATGMLEPLMQLLMSKLASAAIGG